jgi:hypothetical protein
MKAKLTLTVEKEVIEQAKIYAQQTNRSLSKLIEEYLEKITNANYVGESSSIYNKKARLVEEYTIPEWLKDIAGCIEADIDYVKDRDEIREERYQKYLDHTSFI